jgi:hypothetical protein
VPDHAGKVVVLCLRPQREGGTGWRSFPTLADAQEAERARAGRKCSEACEQAHAVCWAEPGKLHVVRGVGDPAPVPSSLAGAIWQAYPPHRNGHQNGHRRKEKPVPRKPKEATVTEPTDEQVDAIIAAERKAGTHLARIGLNRRAVAAYREVADLRANLADAEAIELAEKVAENLTALSTAEMDPDGPGFA